MKANVQKQKLQNLNYSWIVKWFSPVILSFLFFSCSGIRFVEPQENELDIPPPFSIELRIKRGFSCSFDSYNVYVDRGESEEIEITNQFNLTNRSTLLAPNYSLPVGRHDIYAKAIFENGGFLNYCFDKEAWDEITVNICKPRLLFAIQNFYTAYVNHQIEVQVLSPDSTCLGDQLSYALENQPSGATVNLGHNQLGQFTWIPNGSHIGTHSFDIISKIESTELGRKSISINVTEGSCVATNAKSERDRNSDITWICLPDGTCPIHCRDCAANEVRVTFNYNKSAVAIEYRDYETNKVWAQVYGLSCGHPSQTMLLISDYVIDGHMNDVSVIFNEPGSPANHAFVSAYAIKVGERISVHRIHDDSTVVSYSDATVSLTAATAIINKNNYEYVHCLSNGHEIGQGPPTVCTLAD